MAEITEKMAKMTFNQSPEAKAHYDGLIAYEQHGHIIAPEVGQEYWIPVQGGGIMLRFMEDGSLLQKVAVSEFYNSFISDIFILFKTGPKFSPFRLNAEGERVTIKSEAFRYIVKGEIFKKDAKLDEIRLYLSKCLPAPFSPGKAKKRNKKAGATAAPAVVVLTVQTSDEETVYDESDDEEEEGEETPAKDA